MHSKIEDLCYMIAFAFYWVEI